MIDVLASSPLARAAGLALVEFVWQGALIAAATALGLAALRQRSAQAKYAAACVGLALMCSAPVVTGARMFDRLNVPISDRATVAAPRTTTVAGQAPLQQPREAQPPVSPDPWSIRVREWIDARLPAILLIWAAGVCVLGLRFAGGWLRLARLQRDARLVTASRLALAAESLARRIGIRRPVRLLSSTHVAVPAVVGWFKPAILFPASLLAGMPAAHLEAILAHELAHIRRADFLVNLLQCAAELLLFYHPAVWWVSRQVRVERELCADDSAVAILGDRVTYARALASLETMRSVTPALAMGAGDDLLARVKRLVDPGATASPRLRGGFAMTVLLLLLMSALTGQTRATLPPTEMGAAQVTMAPAPTEPIATITDTPVTRRQSPQSQQSTTRATPTMSPGPATLPTQAAQATPQAGRGSVTGTVQDRTGGVLPGVTVVIVGSPSPARSTVTNPRGMFTFGDLPAGEYELTVSLPGFKTNRSRLHLPPDAHRSVTLRLEVGTLSETVTVRSSAMAASGPPAGQQQPASVYLDLAKTYYQQGRYAEAEEMTMRAVQFMRAELPTVAATIPEPVPSGPVRVGGSIVEPKKIRDVKPVYPSVAMAARVEGTVFIEATVASDGTVRDARVIRGVPLLDEAALTAVQQWLYTPTKLNGAPIEVVMTVSVTFMAR